MYSARCAAQSSSAWAPALMCPPKRRGGWRRQARLYHYSQTTTELLDVGKAWMQLLSAKRARGCVLVPVAFGVVFLPRENNEGGLVGEA